MSHLPMKECPGCRTDSPLEAKTCGRCGHVFKTQFVQGVPLSENPAFFPQAPAPVTTPKPEGGAYARVVLDALLPVTAAGLLVFAVEWNAIEGRGFGRFALLLILGALVNAVGVGFGRLTRGEKWGVSAYALLWVVVAVLGTVFSPAPSAPPPP